VSLTPALDSVFSHYLIQHTTHTHTHAHAHTHVLCAFQGEKTKQY
jgi:hypothetical protein